MELPRVSVIIPTLCSIERAGSLFRAIDSVAGQAGVRVEIIVVANGPRIDPATFARLEADPRIRLVRREEGSGPAANRHGRGLATGEYFAFLDDDDEYLPGALATRVAALAADPGLDLVVTNGRRSGGDPAWHSLTAAGIVADPLGTFVQENWLASCAGLFRSATISVDDFVPVPPLCAEWTLLAFRLVLAGRRIGALDAATYLINDTPGSASKSMAYYLGVLHVLDRLLALPVPRLYPELRRKRANTLHALAERCLLDGRRLAAWAWHLRCLAGGGAGVRYLSFTRRLLLPRPSGMGLAERPVRGRAKSSPPRSAADESRP